MMDVQLEKKFGKHIRALRLSAGLTQEQVAARLQVSGVDLTRSALAKIEAGQRHIYLEEILGLQKALEVSYDELLRFAEGKNRDNSI